MTIQAVGTISKKFLKILKNLSMLRLTRKTAIIFDERNAPQNHELLDKKINVQENFQFKDDIFQNHTDPNTFHNNIQSDPNTFHNNIQPDPNTFHNNVQPVQNMNIMEQPNPVQSRQPFINDEIQHSNTLQLDTNMMKNNYDNEFNLNLTPDKTVAGTEFENVKNFAEETSPYQEQNTTRPILEQATNQRPIKQQNITDAYDNMGENMDTSDVFPEAEQTNSFYQIDDYSSGIEKLDWEILLQNHSIPKCLTKRIMLENADDIPCSMLDLLNINSEDYPRLDFNSKDPDMLQKLSEFLKIKIESISEFESIKNFLQLNLKQTLNNTLYGPILDKLQTDLKSQLKLKLDKIKDQETMLNKIQNINEIKEVIAKQRERRKEHRTKS
eukprot:UN06821